MGLSRLIVLILWMFKDALFSIGVFSLALILTALVLIWEGGSERWGSIRTAIGGFHGQLKGYNNPTDLFEYLADR